jgi:hypothetical protein
MGIKMGMNLQRRTAAFAKSSGDPKSEALRPKALDWSISTPDLDVLAADAGVALELLNAEPKAPFGCCDLHGELLGVAMEVAAGLAERWGHGELPKTELG